MRSFLLALLALVACGDWATGPGRPPDQFRFSVAPANGPAPAPVVTPIPGALAVDGTLLTPVPCYEAAARVERNGSAITITVTAHPNGEAACIAVLGALTYHVEAAQLAAGSYALVVRHTFVGATTMDTVVQQAVTIP